MKLILRYLFKYKGLLLLDIFSSFGFALCELGIPTIISNMIDNGVETADVSVIYSWFWVIAGISVIGTAGTLLLAFCSTKISTNVVYDLRKDIMAKAMSFSHKEMEHFGVSTLITRTGSDPYQIMMFLNTILRSAVISPVMLVVSILLVIKTNLKLSLIILATIPLIIAGVILIAKISEPLSKNQQRSIDKINEILRENMSGIRVIRSFNNQKFEEERFEKENAYYTAQSRKLFKLMSVSEPLFFLLMNIAVLFIYYFASIMLQNHTLLIGQLIAFVEYLFHAMMSVLVFCMVFMMYPRASVSAKRIEEVFHTHSSIISKDNQDSIGKVEELEFDNVGFVYTNGEEAVLEGVSFKARPGEKIAVIGSTGSGKSTLAKLIPRFYDATMGEIRINSKNIKEYDVKELRDKIGFVSQKAHLFSGTIADNIRFGNRQASIQDLKEAASISQAEEFIAGRSLGMEDIIAEEGTNVSGGQKQRLSIARAVVKKPDIYVYDDSFSALDLKTDQALRKALKPLVKEAVFIVVAQRVTTILDADQIIVLDQGKVAGIGTHEQLMKSCSIYQEIVLSQLSEKEVAKWKKS